jgi:hypothetical protein
MGRPHIESAGQSPRWKALAAISSNRARELRNDVANLAAVVFLHGREEVVFGFGGHWVIARRKLPGSLERLANGKVSLAGDLLDEGGLRVVCADAQAQGGTDRRYSSHC